MKEKEVKELTKKRFGEVAKTHHSSSRRCGSSTTDTSLRIYYTAKDLENIPEAILNVVSDA